MIHFIGLKLIENYDKITFPNTNEVNVIYLFHDHEFKSMIMKIQKKDENQFKIIKVK